MITNDLCRNYLIIYHYTDLRNCEKSKLNKMFRSHPNIFSFSYIIIIIIIIIELK